MQKLSDNIKWIKIHLIGNPEGKIELGKKIEEMIDNFEILLKNTKP